MIERTSHWTRVFLAAAALLLGVIAWGGTSGGSTLRTSHAPHKPAARINAVYLAQENSKVLVNASGYVLYMFVPDHQHRVTCNITCVASWPPFTVAPGTHPQAGAGVRKSLIGTVRFTRGYRVVSYNRWPLYTYQDDYNPGMVTGQGTDLNGGFWYLVKPNGMPLVPAGDPSP
jgi:predicted lipoprotein with Yx(FWY)xxD motif